MIDPCSPFLSVTFAVWPLDIVTGVDPVAWANACSVSVRNAVAVNVRLPVFRFENVFG